MAKRRRRSRARGECFHEREVVESRLRISVPSNYLAKDIRVELEAEHGELVMTLTSLRGDPVYLKVSGIELHTALHALGFVRLNDRCGQS